MSYTGPVYDTHAMKFSTPESLAASLKHCVCGGSGWFRVNVPVNHPLFGQAIMCVCRRDESARKKAADLRRLSGLSEKGLAAYTFTSFDVTACVPANGVNAELAISRMRSIYEDMCAYARKPQGWRILSGSHGAGKTHLAAAVVRHQVMAANRSAYIGTAPDMLDMLRQGYQTNLFDEMFDRLRKVQMLAIDDLGTQNATAWTVEKLYQIINYRLENRLALIVTTNENLRSAPDSIDGRIVSRLLSGVDSTDGWSRYHVFPVADYRPKVGY